MKLEKRTEELWKEIEGTDGFYFISTHGRLKNKKGYIQTGWSNDKYNHRKVRLYFNGSKKDYYLHRLVANAFIPNIENKPSINHIDSNPLNNNVENLEWCTQQENMHHAKINNRYNHEGLIVINKENGIFYQSIKEAAETLNIKPNTLVCKLLGKTKNKTNLILAL